ncbi:MAG: hypothetical protein H6720_13970 [Sandaracinus sp.]|nr:hypothetical protein [Sandaracinus sp.]
MRASFVGYGVLVLVACSGGGGAGSDAGFDAFVARTDGAVEAGAVDARVPDPEDAAVTDAALDAAFEVDASRPTPLCEVSEERIACVRRSLVLRAAGLDRAVHFQWPSGEPPSDGFPAVLLFQGTASPAGLAWVGERDGAYGAYYQADVIRGLLEAGFAVITPEAQYDGAGAWNTNVAPWNYAWESSPDHALMLAIFEALEAGDFGALDAGSLYAAGLSSGGYMSSRVAITYDGRFRRLAIASASYATCAGSFCSVPALEADHPPTLFLHGGLDSIVPPSTMRLYADELERRGVVHSVVVDPAVGHAWIPASADAIVTFFRGG